MTGLGTIINTAAVVGGGLIGMGLKSGLKKQVQDALMQACGVATIFIGAAGVLSKMLVFKNGVFETQGTMLLIFSLVIGAIFGNGLILSRRWIRLEKRLKML